jgi:tetratricopeptide (TPR) repeat protein
MRANLQEALKLSKELQDQALINHTLIAMSARGEVTIEQAEASIQQLEREQNLPLLKEAYFPLIWLHLQAGNYERAIACCDRSIELAARLEEPPVMYPTFKGRALIQLGRYGQAWDALQDEVTDQSHPFAKAFQGLGTGWYYYHLEAYDQALATFEQAYEGMTRVGRPWFRLDALSGLALAHIGCGTINEDMLARLKADVSGFDLEFRAVILSAIELYFGRPEEALRLARIAQKQEMEYMKGFQVFHSVDGLLLECHAFRQLNQPQALLEKVNEGLWITGRMAYRPAAWKFNGLKGWALDRIGQKNEADRAYQAAATVIRELAETIEKAELQQSFLTSKPAEHILTRVGDR